jgi:hypothetical protein
MPGTDTSDVIALKIVAIKTSVTVAESLIAHALNVTV